MTNDTQWRQALRLQMIGAIFVTLLWLVLKTQAFVGFGRFSWSGLWWCLLPWGVLGLFWLKGRTQE